MAARSDAELGKRTLACFSADGDEQGDNMVNTRQLSLFMYTAVQLRIVTLAAVHLSGLS